MTNITGRFSLVAAAGLTLALAGCAALPGNQPLPRLFVLTPKSTFDPNLPKASWQLTVDKPVAEAGLNTARIALRHSPVTLEYFARANWVDTAPIMIQTLIVKSFENSGKIIAVGRQSVSLRADYSLIPELREFQAEYNGKAVPVVRVRI
ncbi:MAG: ABC-type transport auxiliary lipoprotein family protein, partial [Alphaproteobacteria bacterium]